MKYDTITLDKNEVLYVYDRVYGHDGVNSTMDMQMIRVENIDGNLYPTMLPDFYVLEKGAKKHVITPNTNTLITSKNRIEDIVIKKGNIVDIPDIIHMQGDYDENEGISKQRFKVYKQTLKKLINMESIANPDFSFANGQVWIAKLAKAAETCGINVDNLYNKSYQEIVRYVNNRLARARAERIAESKPEA